MESQQYFSWERYFTAVLMQKTVDSYLKYTKSKLNPVYLQEHEKKAVLSEMSRIQLDKKDIYIPTKQTGLPHIHCAVEQSCSFNM